MKNETIKAENIAEKAEEIKHNIDMLEDCEKHAGLSAGEKKTLREFKLEYRILLRMLRHEHKTGEPISEKSEYIYAVDVWLDEAVHAQALGFTKLLILFAEANNADEAKEKVSRHLKSQGEVKINRMKAIFAHEQDRNSYIQLIK